VTRIITERQYHHVAPRLAACGFVAEVQGRFLLLYQSVRIALKSY
jgi:hypothetical protein